METGLALTKCQQAGSSVEYGSLQAVHIAAEPANK